MNNNPTSINREELRELVRSWREVWLDSKTIHKIVKLRLRLMALIWEDKYLQNCDKQLEECAPSQRLRILKTHIKTKEILEKYPTLFSKTVTDILKIPSSNSPHLLAIAEKHIERMWLAA